MSADFSEVKDGDRVRLVYEFDVGSKVGYNYVTDGDWEFYPQNLVCVEILEPPLPTEDGWYESEPFPLSAGWMPYQIKNGEWLNCRDQPLVIEVVAVQGPWHRLVRETSS